MSLESVIVLVLSFVLSVVGTLIAPYVRDAIALLSKTMTRRRLRVLESDLLAIDQKPVDLFFTLAAYLFQILLLLILALILFGLSGSLALEGAGHITIQRLILNGESTLLGISSGLAASALRIINRRNNQTLRTKLVERIAYFKSKVDAAVDNPQNASHRAPLS